MAQVDAKDLGGHGDRNAQTSHSNTSHAVSSSRTSSTVEAEERVGFFGRILLFIRQVLGELKKVIWPSRNELWTYFWVVIIFVVILMAAIFVFDTFFSWVTKLIFA